MKRRVDIPIHSAPSGESRVPFQEPFLDFGEIVLADR